MPPINKKSETQITPTIYCNYDISKKFNLSNIKLNTIGISLNVFYKTTSTNSSKYSRNL